MVWRMKVFARRQSFGVVTTGLLVLSGAMFVSEIRMPSEPVGLATTRAPTSELSGRVLKDPLLEGETQRVRISLVQDGAPVSPSLGGTFVLDPEPFELHLRGDFEHASYFATLMPEVVQTVRSAPRLVAPGGTTIARDEGTLAGLHEVMLSEGLLRPATAGCLAPIEDILSGEPEAAVTRSGELQRATGTVPMIMPWGRASLSPPGDASDPGDRGHDVWQFERLEQTELEHLDGTTVYLILFLEQPLSEVGRRDYVALSTPRVLALQFRSR